MSNKRSVMLALALVLYLLAANAPAQTTFKLKKILQTGDNAPVAGRLSSVDEFSQNDNGLIAFTGDGGLFLKSGSSVTPIVGFGDPAPGGGTFIQASSHVGQRVRNRALKQLFRRIAEGKL